MEGHKSKIIPPVYVLISVLIILFLHFVLPGPVIIPKPWNLLGILLMALGLAVLALVSLLGTLVPALYHAGAALSQAVVVAFL